MIVKHACNLVVVNYALEKDILEVTFEPETPAGHPKYQKTWIVA